MKPYLHIFYYRSRILRHIDIVRETVLRYLYFIYACVRQCESDRTRPFIFLIFLKLGPFWSKLIYVHYSLLIIDFYFYFLNIIWKKLLSQVAGFGVKSLICSGNCFVCKTFRITSEKRESDRSLILRFD